jgi:chorismate dehydratase
MIKLGHIEYSNCFPVHALLLEEPQPDIEIVAGTPSQLNKQLAAGVIDVAPSSSIEYARSGGAYRLLPDFVIGSDGAVGSILFETTDDIASLADRVVAVPTASATSVVLLKILLQERFGVQPRYQWFEQETSDPIAAGASGALWIGDVALRRAFPADRRVHDLGAIWKDWTGLPFVFAAWQTSALPARDGELGKLSALLRRSRAYFNDNAARLADARAAGFGLSPERLLGYWQSLRYDFDERMQQGLLKYYELAAQLGETPRVTRLDWVG